MLTRLIPGLTKLNAHTVLNKFRERNAEMGEPLAHFCYHCLKTEENKYTDVPPLIPLVIIIVPDARPKAKSLHSTNTKETSKDLPDAVKIPPYSN